MHRHTHFQGAGHTQDCLIDEGYDFGVILNTLKQGSGRPSKRSPQSSAKRFIPILDRDLLAQIQFYL